MCFQRLYFLKTGDYCTIITNTIQDQVFIVISVPTLERTECPGNVLRSAV